MKIRAVVCIPLVGLAMAVSLAAQAPSRNTVATAQVPRLVRFSGTLGAASANSNAEPLADRNGAAPSRVVGVTFALYADETGGAPLWLETQNVQVDSAGHYLALLGSTKAEGLPVELFTSGQAQWLGVQAGGRSRACRASCCSACPTR